jgi:hypothetical protein
VPQQRPSDPARPAEQGEHPDQTALTHLHWEYQGTNTDVYTDGARSAHLYGPTDRAHLGSEGAEAAKGDPAALPAEVGRYLSTGDRQVGIPVVGERPDKSPGDTSDLPPTGGELLEPDDNKRSRMERLREKAESSEVLGDTPDSAQQQCDAVHEILDARHPQGATVQVTSDSPHILSPAADQPGLGDIAYAGVGLTILCVELGRKIHDMLRHEEKG